MFQDTVLIVFISLCTALASEAVLYFLVYRTENYKRLKTAVEKQSKKLEKKKELIGDRPAGQKGAKKIEKAEEQLKNVSRDLSMIRMQSVLVIGFTFTALLGMFNTIFDGRVVAKLPFEPFGIVQSVSHRNLMGKDITDCSFLFLYILCTMSIRENVQKLLGFGPSRTASKMGGGMFGPAPSTK
eukprot:Em0016g1170a